MRDRDSADLERSSVLQEKNEISPDILQKRFCIQREKGWKIVCFVTIFYRFQIDMKNFNSHKTRKIE